MAKWQSKSSFFQQLLSNPWKTSQWITNVFFVFLNQWSSLFPSWWSRLRNPSPVVIAHLNYSAYRVVLCVWCKKKARCVRYLRPSVDFLGKNFPFIIVLFRFPFFHCIFQNDYATLRTVFFTCVWNNRVLRSMKLRNIFIFLSLLKLPPKRNIGALHKILLRIPANNKV